ncbi:MAG: hypothetical protein BJ554DRAFT_8115 [Olpidium bornovanus]|uniref:Reverse transcriptase domain-containing protein n=1 Tax=Olpidium bornovanus TaxID=278681 RepID=A0A8H8DIX1_9FUNG|nr:MAG: hypothetical protein BJ554DRAFT_8115 [Olpidium bornovanus]
MEALRAKMTAQLQALQAHNHQNHIPVANSADRKKPSEQERTVAKLLRAMLENDAIIWYELLNQVYEWNEFRDEFLPRFRDPQAEENTRAQLHKLEQKASAKKYTEEFKRLAACVSDLTEADRLQTYKRGLKATLRHDLAIMKRMNSTIAFQERKRAEGKTEKVRRVKEKLRDRKKQTGNTRLALDREKPNSVAKAVERQELQGGAPTGNASPSYGPGKVLKADKKYDSFDIRIALNGQTVLATIDSGCTGALVSDTFATAAGWKTATGAQTYLEFVSGRVASSDKYVQVDATIGNTVQPLRLLVAPISTDVLLGLGWLQKHNPIIDWKRGTLSLGSHQLRVEKARKNSFNIRIVNTTNRTSRIVESVSERRLFKDARKGLCFRVTSRSEMVPKTPEKDQDHPFKDILSRFADVMPETLRPVGTLRCRTQGIEHEIRLTPEHKPHSQPIYHLSVVELEELRRQLQELQAAGHILPSRSPWGAPVLFVKKMGSEKLRMCVDFRRLNSMTIKDATPLVLPEEMRHRLAGARFFSTLNLTQGYYQIPVALKDIEKTAFRTRDSHFEWTVMPFGLCNAPATFTRWMNAVLGDLMDMCVVAYMDDILIYSETKQDHRNHLEQVLQLFRKHQVYIN